MPIKKLTVKTTRFGDLEVEEKGIITIQGGLLGFPEYERYMLLDSEENSPFKWFQSVDDSALAFVLIDPELVDPSYKITIETETLEMLELHDVKDCIFFTIVTLNKNPHKVTANMLGPIIINPQNCRGCQVVLSDSRYTIRQKILSE
jgi:flagellar assembly factor FliW